ncbi:DNA-binding protein [Candidatus Nanohalobium constans]|uniref:DNA-binding protein / programmed cell death protein 5 n=1 Tax=Candidatus Nanohalobium constans TaxID=2565781 RepID=A0A5Q0UGM4_9ARCH|nr:DNA-binding protein [Candidatus Nanohalobium constans]QGA80139.1 DNA-binding protein / programmed cell death protein 5 [Candidatus Nanohalobium constans]
MDEDTEDLREQKRKEIENQQENQEEALEEQRKQVQQQAAQYLTKEAKSRLGNIRAADPDKAASVEMQIVQLGKRGQISKINDDQLKDILKSISEEESENESDIKFRR